LDNLTPFTVVYILQSIEFCHCWVSMQQSPF